VLLQMRTKQETAQTCLEALPAQLDRVDALLAEGVIGGEQPNAADFQIAPSVRLMLTFDQLRPHIDARPAGVLILTWDIADEVMATLESTGGWGAEYVVPLPVPRTLRPASGV
jgi:hypothetical protein